MRLLVIWIHVDQSSSFKIAKKIVISHTQKEILKQKKFPGSKFEGTPKLLKALFSSLFLCQNYETLEVPTRAVFHPLICNLAVL